jgi:hypothetical protein
VNKWTASDQFSVQGSGSQITPLPLIKLSPQLMQVENLSLSSVSRSVRAVGAGDLRDALQGPPTSAGQNSHEPNFARHDIKPSSTEQTLLAGRVTDSPGAVQELFASIGLGIRKESTQVRLRPQFTSTKVGHAGTQVD